MFTVNTVLAKRINKKKQKGVVEFHFGWIFYTLQKYKKKKIQYLHIWYWTCVVFPRYFWKASLVGAKMVTARNCRFDSAILFRSIRS